MVVLTHHRHVDKEITSLDVHQVQMMRMFDALVRNDNAEFSELVLFKCPCLQYTY